MKVIMREYGKTAGIAAAGAFFLSLVVGLISRNPFAVALARAILFALFFAGLGAGARYVVRKYLSELTAAKASAGEAPRGQSVDITLPEERPAPAASAYARAQADAVPSGDALPSDEPSPAPAQDVLELEEAPRAESQLTEDDLDAMLPPLAEGSGAEEAGEESVEEAESISEEGPPDASPGERSAEVGSEDLGRLPDISELGSPSASVPPRGSRGPRTPGPRGPFGGERLGSTPEDEMKGALGNQDPSTLARAIRTVLKRDEKG